MWEKTGVMRGEEELFLVPVRHVKRMGLSMRQVSFPFKGRLDKRVDTRVTVTCDKSRCFKPKHNDADVG